jgi:uncharacterized protein
VVGDVVFLDANVLFSAAYRPGAGLLRLWDLPDVRVVSSAYALEEARRNLSDAEQLARLDSLAVRTEIRAEESDAPLPHGVTLPAKDRPILGGAILTGATHLLTGDVRHFGRYFGKTIGGVHILPPGDYLRGYRTAAV